MLDVTVIVPTFNRAALLAEALSSLKAQSRPPCEILVVDDGSSDDTAAVAGRYGAGRHGEGLRYLRKENGGKSSALNLGISEARGEAIWILDDDDLALPDGLEHLAEALERRPDAGFAYGALREFETGRDGERRLGRTRGSLALEGRDYFHAVLEGRALNASPALLVKRACYEAVGPYEETLSRSQDLEMLLRLSRRFHGVPAGAVVYLQRQHGGERGTGAERFAAEERDRHWTLADQEIFSRFLKELPPAELLPAPACEPLSQAERREAGLRRFAVLARRKLWVEALAELAAATALDSEPLTPRELKIAATALYAPYGIEELTQDPSIVASLRQIATETGWQPLLRAVAEAVPHHAFYALRRGHLATARRLLALNRSLLGRSEARRNLVHATARRLAGRREDA